MGECGNDDRGVPNVGNLYRGFPKMMRGDYSHIGNAQKFVEFSDEFFESIQQR